ncbi:MAG: hypothetical protein K2X55_07580 [Burkholderiaceae bacterium]|nr:hypothetical protein [Burkholderiaceae bacterium]
MTVNDDDAALEAGFYSEQIAKRIQVRAQCEKRGLHWARSCVGTRSDGEVAEFMAEWIGEFEEQQRVEQMDRAHKLTQRGVEAAEQSAESADKSVVSAGASARAAIASTIISFFALVVAVAAYLKN